MSKIAMKVSNLIKRYKTGVDAVKGLTFSVFEGECFALLGPNGAGKSTTLQMMQGLLIPNSGTLEIFGKTFQSNDFEIRELLGGILQDNVFYERTKVGELVTLFASLYKNPLPREQVLSELNVLELQSVFLKNLSGGQRQRAFLAAALVGNPKILFLDEPTTGLDPASRQDFWHSIKRIQGQGKTIVLTTHYMEEAQFLSDRLAIINEGTLLELGSPQEVIDRVMTGKPIPKVVTGPSLNDVFLTLTGRQL